MKNISLPIRLTVTVAISIFIVEMVIMRLLPFLHLDSPWAEMLLDAGVLVLTLVPILYAFILRPMTSEMSAREEAQLQLRTVNAGLERRVAERTRELEVALKAAKRAEEEIRHGAQRSAQAEQEFRTLFAANPLPMWIYDLTTLQFLEVNDAAVGHYGYERNEFLAMTIKDIRPPEDVEGLLADLGQPREMWQAAANWRHRLKSGQIIDVDITSHTITFAERPAALVVAQDVTGRKQAEETRARLAAIVDSSDDAIFAMAPDNTILTWNTGAERLYGYTANEVIGRSRALIVPAGKVAELTTIMERVARGEPGEPFETQRTRKDGSMIDVSLTISPMTDSTGRVIGSSTIARDITSRMKAEAELTRLNHEIQLQRLRVFKATIRTVQDIVNNLLNGFLLVRVEGEGQLPAELLTLVDQMIQEAGVKLKALGDLETVKEKEMAIGMGIDYPGAAF